MKCDLPEHQHQRMYRSAAASIHDVRGEYRAKSTKTLCQRYLDGHARYSAYIGIDTPNRNRKHTIKVGFRQFGESNEIAEGEDAGEQACLNCATNKLVYDGICLPKTCLGSCE